MLPFTGVTRSAFYGRFGGRMPSKTLPWWAVCGFAAAHGPQSGKIGAAKQKEIAMTKTRWGILGTGNIASQFARGLAELDDAELVAVGSRTAESAETFGERFSVLRRHGSYTALANDPDVD